MPKTYVELNQEIEALKAEAEAVFETEVVEVIGRIRKAIDVYGLTAEDLGFTTGGKAKPAPDSAAAPARQPGRAKKAAATGKAPIKYRDSAGNTWSGRGHRPRWMQSALDAGESIESLTVSPADAATADAPAAGLRKGSGSSSDAKPKPAPSVPKYKDDAGHTWSGRGPRPRWFKEAIERGVTPEQMAA